ncbi:LOW QUALITY PROTEIN: semaphorin-4C-like [Callospermophilus lateralis]
MGTGDPIFWEAPAEKKIECSEKGKSNHMECFNCICFLQPYNTSHLYVCGTYAFPKCTYINMLTFTLEHEDFDDGKGNCPYDPAKGHTGLLVDGELYSATLNNFLGTQPVILQNMGPYHPMKAEYEALWLNRPHFIASAYVPESVGSITGDDDKVYFFSERVVEYDCCTKQLQAQVARVCKSDIAGAHTLQKKWTKFLKSQLGCSVPNQQLYFNQLQSVHTLQGASWHKTTFFGCINKWHHHHGHTSSLELADRTLIFIKKHPLMDEQVEPSWGQPLLMKTPISPIWWLTNLQDLTKPPIHCCSLAQKLLFAGSCSHLVQLPLADSVKYYICADCVLEWDSYSAWSINTSHCLSVASYSGQVNAEKHHNGSGHRLATSLSLSSKLAYARWIFEGQDLPADEPCSIHYDAHLQALVKLQVKEEYRATFSEISKSGYWLLSEMELQVLLIITKCFEDMKDTQILIEVHKSSYARPGDVEFEDFSQPVICAHSENGLDTCSDGEPKFQGPGHSCAKRWPFGKKSNVGAQNVVYLEGKEGGLESSGVCSAWKLQLQNPRLNPLFPLQTVASEDFSHLPLEQQRKQLQYQLEEHNQELKKR